MAQAIQDLRANDAILKKPSIAETLDWVSALEALGISDLTPEAVRETRGFVLKNSEDLEVVENGIPRPEGAQEAPHQHCGHCHHDHAAPAEQPDDADKIQRSQQRGEGR